MAREGGPALVRLGVKLLVGGATLASQGPCTPLDPAAHSAVLQLHANGVCRCVYWYTCVVVRVLLCVFCCTCVIVCCLMHSHPRVHVHMLTQLLHTHCNVFALHNTLSLEHPKTPTKHPQTPTNTYKTPLNTYKTPQNTPKHLQTLQNSPKHRKTPPNSPKHLQTPQNTHRAPPAATLGFAQHHITHLPADRALRDGGPVSVTVLCVQRAHPVQWFESTASGPVYRSARAQEEHRRQQQAAMQQVQLMECLGNTQQVWVHIACWQSVFAGWCKEAQLFSIELSTRQRVVRWSVSWQSAFARRRPLDAGPCWRSGPASATVRCRWQPAHVHVVLRQRKQKGKTQYPICVGTVPMSKLLLYYYDDVDGFAFCTIYTVYI